MISSGRTPGMDGNRKRAASADTASTTAAGPSRAGESSVDMEQKDDLARRSTSTTLPYEVLDAVFEVRGMLDCTTCC